MTTKMDIYPWLTTTWQRIKKLKKANGFPHALILSGIKGIGKSDLAKITAKWLVCQNPNELPCQQCRSCQLFLEGHPDVRYLGEESELIGIDEIRRMQEFCQLSAHFQGFKVLVLDADKLNQHSVNALLKILEEPASGVIFILKTAQYHLLLPTLVSRCLRISIPVPSENEAVDWLQSYSQSPEDIQHTLILARGAPLGAVELLSGDLLNATKARKDCVELFLNQEYKEFPYESVQEYVGQSLSTALYLLYQHIVQFIHQRVEKDLKLTLSVEKYLLFLDKIKEAMEAMYLTGVNKQMLMESLFYQWRLINNDGALHESS